MVLVVSSPVTDAMFVVVVVVTDVGVAVSATRNGVHVRPHSEIIEHFLNQIFLCEKKVFLIRYGMT